MTMLSPTIARLCQGFFNRPATAIEPAPQKVLSNLQASGLCRNRQGFAVVFNKACPSRVLALFDLGGPSHVIRFVVAVVVNAFERVVGRGAPADVAEEGCKGLLPLFRDGNAAPSIVFKRGMVGVAAARFHGRPRRVFSRSLALRGFAVRKTWHLEMLTRLSEW